jgi:hypothetical protein
VHESVSVCVAVFAFQCVCCVKSLRVINNGIQIDPVNNA